MQTPMKYALGFLALIAVTAAPFTSAGQADHAHGFVLEGGLMTVGPVNVFNACDDTDLGSTLYATAYANTGGNSRPGTLFRAGDQGVSSSCVAIWAAEQGQLFTIVANGCLTGAPTYVACTLWTKKAANLGTQACFYDGVSITAISCAGTYNDAGDLILTVPAGAVLMSVDMPVTSSLMSWWFYEGVIY